MASGPSKKIVNLSRHSFTNKSEQDLCAGRKFSNINTQAVIYNNEQLQQLYTGLYLDENLHNIGTYRWLSNCGSHKYEGKLFLNHMHGYGKLSYPDDTLYEGLFYFNKKFGPGVVTYVDQRQDVGLWDGNFLIRLCNTFSFSEFYREPIPKLSDMFESKLYLLQFKHLIPISEKYKDSAKEILTKLGATDNVLANKNLLYSKQVRNPKSAFVNGEKLYKNFFTYEDELHTAIDVVDHIDKKGEPVIIKLEVCNLVAWNNEEINTVILKHTFLNRHHEKLLSFKIKDILCSKKRGNFLPPGPIERKSQELIFACRSSDPIPVRTLITEYDLYPDVADCRGNNTVTYATLANQPNIIKVLSEFGANLNSFNDDCITPLIFAILQYIASKYDIINPLWETAFIYAKTEHDLPACNQQWPKASLTSVSKNSSINFRKSVGKRKSVGNEVGTPPSNTEIVNSGKLMERRYSLSAMFKDYIFSLECSQLKRKSNDATVKNEEPQDKSTDFMYEQFKFEEMNKIKQTISTLLLCGANANTGEVPFCPIITCIFCRSKDLIQMLIEFNASVNAKTCEFLGKLGPLHVIGSLSPCLEQVEMAYTFLENGAYVDDLSNKIHWLEEQSVLLANVAPEDCLEKTPLHLVCMRYDFNNDKSGYLTKLALLFVQYGANLNLKYLGHTPLTLAMMRGNTKLMETLLQTGLVDPNEGLGYGMGVPLTICILNRYSKLFNNSMIKQLYSILTKFYANPLNDVPNFDGNAIEFYHNEQSMLLPTRRNSISKLPYGLQLLQCAKTILLKHIESKVVQILYLFKIVYGLDSLLYQAIVKYLKYPRTVEILQILIDHDEIVPDDFNFKKLLHFVDKTQSNYYKNIIKTSNKYVKFYFGNYVPEIDPDDLKYKVCFECFRKTDQLLLLCPKCEMVYFCSQDCNKRNSTKPDSGHPCMGTFYEDELIYAQSNEKRFSSLDYLISQNMKIENFLTKRKIENDQFDNNKTASGDDKTKLDQSRKESNTARSETDQSRKESGTAKNSTTGDNEKESQRSSQKRNKEKLGKSSRDGTDVQLKKGSRRSNQTTSTDFGENMYDTVNLNLKQKKLKGSRSAKHGLQVFVGSKIPVIDIDKRNMYLKIRAQMLEKDIKYYERKPTPLQSRGVREKLKMDKNCTERMLKLARKKIPNLPIDYEELDVNFWQIFSPYCIFQNGQLYYNFNEENSNVYYKIKYSGI